MVASIAVAFERKGPVVAKQQWICVSFQILHSSNQHTWYAKLPEEMQLLTLFDSQTLQRT